MEILKKILSKKEEASRASSQLLDEQAVRFFEQVKKRYSLLKALYRTNSIKIAEIAEEIGTKKTDLMQFVLDYRDYFVLQLPKNSLGLEITNIYDDLSENPFTEEYLQKKIEDNKKNIWFVPIMEYRSVAGWQLIESTEEEDPNADPSVRKKHLWKNTKEKVEEIRKLGFLHKQQFYFGPFSERQPRIFDNAMLEAERKEMVEKFKAAGWNVIFE